MQADGGILISGWFSAVNGVFRGGVARLRPDGSLDTEFSLAVSQFEGIGGLALRSDGTTSVEVQGFSTDGKLMLYGIRDADQRRLRSQGRTVKTLIAYGTAWYKWYMRRLAERPANVWFVVKSMLG